MSSWMSLFIPGCLKCFPGRQNCPQYFRNAEMDCQHRLKNHNYWWFKNQQICAPHCNKIYDRLACSVARSACQESNWQHQVAGVTPLGQILKDCSTLADKYCRIVVVSVASVQTPAWLKPVPRCILHGVMLPFHDSQSSPPRSACIEFMTSFCLMASSQSGFSYNSTFGD